MALKKIGLALVVFCFYVINLNAQNNYFKDIQIRIDSNNYFLSMDAIPFQGSSHLAFQYNRPEQIAIINIYPNNDIRDQIEELRLMPSGDYDMIDSMYLFDNSFYQIKLKFTNLNESKFLKFVFGLKLSNHTKEIFIPVYLLPYTATHADLKIDDNQLFVGEQKSFVITSNNVNNIIANNTWVENENIDYRLSIEDGKLLLHVLPHKTGKFTVNIDINTRQPYVRDNQIIYALPVISQTFQVKSSRLRFLSLDVDEVEITSPDNEQIQVQIDDHAGLQLNKTYRIESKEEPGGELYGELFVRRYLSNNRVLAWLRTYKYHQQSEGYLYIKDGDVAHYITNFNIVPKTKIEKVSVLRQGKDWSNSLTVYPGETIMAKIEGESVHRANFQFSSAEIISSETGVKNSTRREYEIKIPINIVESKIEILNNGEPTNFELKVSEFQKPREFDFITINYGAGKKVVSGIDNPILYENTIQDVVVNFDANKIDQGDQLYGKQYLEIGVQITNKSNELIEIQKIENVVVCPGENSSRYEYYTSGNCQMNSIQLNQILRKKTFDLPEWSKIEITFKHQKAKYGGEGREKTIEIYNKKSYSFDIEVSFPAGLIEIAKPEEGNDKIGNLTGISMAALAQFSFYHKEKIARYLPYKVGIGFLAINAFDFRATESQRDLGIVILGSLYPTTKDVKLTFPLYFGGGYYLNKEKLFFVVGPGIRLRL